VPAPLATLISELDRLLEPHRFRDYCPNGLQVPGGELVSVVATGVSASAELFERAAQRGAELLVVHHGLFWGSEPMPIDATMKHRLKVLFDANMSLATYHLPLDAHPEVGNNALIARALGVEPEQPFAPHHSEHIGVIARAHDGGLAATELFDRVAKLTAKDPLVFDAGPPQVSRIAIVSGGGSNYLTEAASLGADVLLTGEPTERVMAQAREAHIHFIAAGHYDTETFGVRRLGELLRERFDIEHAFIDVPNPI
jgi:dinuclear metal center YbgI/SA1388 family protein